MYRLLQVLMAVPLLDNLSLTIKLHETKGKEPLDTRVPEVVDETEECVQTAEDLV